MPVPVFREKSPATNINAVYGCTNEEPDILNDMLGNRRFGKAGCILSGGEVLFSVLLPRCGEVFAVDHSYGSMVAAYLKAILLDTMGAKAMKDLLFNGTYQSVLPVLKTAAAQLPPELAKLVKVDATPTGGITMAGTGGLFSYDWSSLRREWYYFTEEKLEAARQRLGKTTVVHGDITDLAEMGPFSLLYVSNAMEHTGRSGVSPKIQDFNNLLRKDGLLLFTTNNPGTSVVIPSGWEKVKTVQGVRTSWWNHLCRKVV